MNTILSIDLIVSNPEVRGGRPIIAGTTLRVSDVVAQHLFQRQSADEIAVGYGLSLGQVHAALAYYYEHKAEIDAEIRQSSERFEALKRSRTGSRHP